MIVYRPSLPPHDSPAARRALAAIQAEVDRLAAAVPADARPVVPFRSAEARDEYLALCATSAATWTIRAIRAAGERPRFDDRPDGPAAAAPTDPEPGDFPMWTSPCAYPAPHQLIEALVARDAAIARMEAEVALRASSPPHLDAAPEAERRLYR